MAVPRWMRYPPGIDFIAFDELPAGVVPEIVYLKAEDGGRSRGLLYARGGERTVVCIMHPRADMTRHYAVPQIVQSGYAFFAQESRWPGNDVNTIHEVLLADVAASIKYLHARNFDDIILLGNSGAGSLYCLYQAQAATKPPRRLTDTAAGDAFDLNKFEMPKAQGFIFLGAHLGAGKILQTEIDPSVTDEKDPLSCDASLDMYNSENGFRGLPEKSSYSAEFLERYRAAQHARVGRIDAIARCLIAEQKAFRDVAAADGFTEMPTLAQTTVLRHAVRGHQMMIHRLEANPASTDLSLHPSPRTYGSLMSTLPELSNYSEGGTKILSPRAWLSSWSAISSRASVLDNLPKVTVPTLVVNYNGDNAIYPFNSDLIFESSPAVNKERVEVAGDHFGLLSDSTKTGGRTVAVQAIIGWLQKYFPGEPH